jgi:hypothetical protein
VLRECLAQAQVEHVEESLLDPEHLGDGDLDARVTLERGVDDVGNVDRRVVRVGEQERHHDDLAVTLGHEPVDDLVEGGLDQVEERRFDAQVGTHARHDLRQGSDRLGRTRVAAAVGQRDESRCGHGASLLTGVVSWCWGLRIPMKPSLKARWQERHSHSPWVSPCGRRSSSPQ